MFTVHSAINLIAGVEPFMGKESVRETKSRERKKKGKKSSAEGGNREYTEILCAFFTDKTTYTAYTQKRKSSGRLARNSGRGVF